MHTITFHTANGPTVTENVANVYVKDLDENITPNVLNNSQPVLTVGYRCMELGYTFIWPTGQNPYFIRPDGMIVHLTVEHYIPYLFLGVITVSLARLQDRRRSNVRLPLYLVTTQSRGNPAWLRTLIGQKQHHIQRSAMVSGLLSRRIQSPTSKRRNWLIHPRMKAGSRLRATNRLIACRELRDDLCVKQQIACITC